MRRIVAAVSASSFIEWAGATAVLPLLPVYLRHHGSSVTLVGMTMAAFFAAAVLVQYPLGRLSDRIGRKKVQIGGLLVYALGSVLFALFTSPVLALCFRALQGAGGGVVDVANAATVGDVVPERWRGRAYGTLYGTRTVGMAIGPFFGGLGGVSGMRWLFYGAAACVLVAALPIKVYVPRGQMGSRPVPGARKAPLLRNRSVLGVMVAFVAGGLLIGMYETCWSLLLALRGAHNWQIGLSWTLFAIPFAIMSWPAGWLVDRMDRRHLVMLALAGSGFFAGLYPFLHSVSLLIGLGAIEAAAVAIGQPAESAQLTHSVASFDLGRAQGAVSSAQTAATAVAATLSGALFGIDPAVPFLLVAGAIGAAIIGCGVFWRGVDGRPRRVGTQSAGVGLRPGAAAPEAAAAAAGTDAGALPPIERVG